MCTKFVSWTNWIHLFDRKWLPRNLACFVEARYGNYYEDRIDYHKDFMRTQARSHPSWRTQVQCSAALVDSLVYHFASEYHLSLKRFPRIHFFKPMIVVEALLVGNEDGNERDI